MGKTHSLSELQIDSQMQMSEFEDCFLPDLTVSDQTEPDQTTDG